MRPNFEAQLVQPLKCWLYDVWLGVVVKKNWPHSVDQYKPQARQFLVYLLEEAQVGIKIAGRNINNLRYADDTTLMAESEEELKSLLMKVKEESEKAGLKLNIQKTNIMASSPISSWQMYGETMKTVTDYFQSVQFSSVAQSCPALCNPMNRSTPGLPVHHQLPEFTQTHVHRVSDAIQPSHPLSPPSPPAPNPSQHQSLVQ